MNYSVQCACEEFSILHDVVYNSKKSIVLICRNKAMAHADPPVFTVNGSIIGESDKLKYLGHIICNDMSDDDDMMRQIRQLYAQGNVLSRRFHCDPSVQNQSHVAENINSVFICAERGEDGL